MKIKTLILALFFQTALFSQELSGDWYGDIEISGMKLGFILHITKADDGYNSKLDIPEQKAMGIPMSSTVYLDGVLKIVSKELGGEFEGKYSENIFNGTFSQNGGVYPFTMSKEIRLVKEQIRPQEPKPKFPYKIENVTFKNPIDTIELSGTLTLPKGRGPFPAVVLVSGSGPQDRNEEILGHKPFWVIADYLTKNGIAVLRYDDRGVGSSTGNFSSATTMDFARDASSAVDYLKKYKKVDKNKIGIIGHSEGGTIAPIVASNPKNNIGFIVMLAGTAIPGSEIILKQQELISSVNGEEEEDIVENKNFNIALFQFIQENQESPSFNADLRIYIDNYFVENKTKLPEGMPKSKVIDFLINTYTSPWMSFFLFYDPQYAFLRTQCPVLALNGSKDLQVTPKENLSLFKSLAELSGNQNVTTLELPNLNHLFQECETGSPSEYGKIEQTFSPEVLVLIKNWIVEL